MKKFILIVLCFIAVPSLSQVVTYDFAGIPATPATTSLPPTTTMNVTASALTEGAGITPVATSGAMNASGWNSTAMDATDYFEFTVTPNANYVFRAASLVFGYRRSAAGPTTYRVGYTIGGGTETLTPATALASSPTVTSSITVPLSFTATQAIRFRLYAWGGSSALGTFRLSNATGSSSGVTLNAVAPLPVKLLSFAGQAAQPRVLLQWTTAWEERNEGFDVLKGQSATALEKVGFVKGGNTTAPATYSFVDTDVQDGKLYYYQLRQWDVEGSSSLSKLIAVRADWTSHEKQPCVYPNPNGGRFVLSLPDATASSIRLYNSVGTEIPLTIHNGPTSQELSITVNAPVGLYYLKSQKANGMSNHALTVIIQ